MAVEAAGAQEGGIKGVWAVGGGNYDNALVGVEAVHFHQHRIERLFVRMRTANRSRASALLANRVDFVDKDDARRVLFRLREHIAHSACTNADKHFLKVGAGDCKEGNLGFAGDSLGEQGLAGAGRAYQQDAFRNPAAKFLEYFGLFEEFDNFLDFLFGFIDTGDIGK